MDIQTNIKLKICDNNNQGITSNIWTFYILGIHPSNNEFLYIDSKTKTNANKKMFVSTILL